MTTLRQIKGLVEPLLARHSDLVLVGQHLLDEVVATTLAVPDVFERVNVKFIGVVASPSVRSAIEIVPPAPPVVKHRLVTFASATASSEVALRGWNTSNASQPPMPDRWQ